MKSELQLDIYLQELIQCRSSSGLKLIAAWNGLSIETQIKILSTVNYIPDEIITKGLNSSNDYIRYLIANRFFYPYEKTDEDKKLLKKISDDENIIVKFTKFPSQRIHVCEKNKDGHDISVLKPENFFAMSKNEQILYFSSCNIRHNGKEIATLIEWGHNNQVDQNHLADLINECAYNFNEDKLYYETSQDGLCNYLYEQELEILWRLVPKLGLTDSAKYLIRSLPISPLEFNSKIFNELLNSLNKELLVDLLERKDFYFLDLRKKIVSSRNPVYDDDVKAAAASKLKNIKSSYIAKQEKREAIKSIMLISMFLLGLVCLFLNVLNWGVYVFIGIPVLFWLEGNIKQSFNKKIDDVVDKIDKKIKKD